MTNPLPLALIGAGTRGMALAGHAQALGVQVVAVAEPDAQRRRQAADAFGIPDSLAFDSWEALCGAQGRCRGAIVATLDNLHTGPALACLDHGWHLLLEKPMAHTLADCQAIEAAQRRAGVALAVCHTLRYLEPYRALHAAIAQGQIGRVIHLEHMEAIGHARFVHNYVRGRWGVEAGNTFLLLHKCCHDLDLIQWLIGQPCQRVASFGDLTHFTEAHAPEGSGQRCAVDCAIADHCPHSALRWYVEGDLTAWPARDVAVVHDRQNHLEAIRTGPYGRCAWRAGNDVVDHQTVQMCFAGGATATCTMTGYSATNGRRTRIQGTEGELVYHETEQRMTLTRFDGTLIEENSFSAPDAYHPEDREIVGDWLQAILDPQRACIAVDAQEALRSHALVFAAEQSRREGRMVALG